MSGRDFADLYLDRLSLESPTAITHDLSVLPSFPVFSSPTATVEVVGNTGKWSSEKAGVGGLVSTLICQQQATILFRATGASRVPPWPVTG